MKNLAGRILPKSVMSRIAPDWSPPPVVPVVRISGVIGGSQPLRNGVTLAALAGPLEQAFSMRGAKAVALIVNSPGGSPVQSSLIFKRIRALSEEKKLPVIVFAEDAAASGGYMIACAGDEIYADESSVLGSIGVISAGFGFTGLIEKLGVERRVHTAGANKGMLDPFQPERQEDVKRLLDLQGEVHDYFKDLVKGRRGEKLDGADDELFSGAFWAAKGALKRGLIDGIGEIRSIMRERFGEEVKLRLVAPRRSFWPFGNTVKSSQKTDALPDFGPNFADSFADGIISALERRSIWSRFGL